MIQIITKYNKYLHKVSVQIKIHTQILNLNNMIGHTLTQDSKEHICYGELYWIFAKKIGGQDMKGRDKRTQGIKSD